ncbi:MAG: cytochrome P450 [Leptolyngbyaceae cyanobacterium MO_188.B28]|nr:cytochrome P450 [Leptolyngbyaceae cyanobacterium MO_188.B28]
MAATSIRPPGPETPDWLQKLQYAFQFTRYLDRVGAYGDVVRAPLIGNNPNTFLVGSPAGIKQLLSGDGGRIGSPPNSHLRPIVGDTSLFVLEGERHRRERRLLMPSFHSERIKDYGHIIRDLTLCALADRKFGIPFPIREVMQNISLDVILKVVFGVVGGNRFDLLKSYILRLAETMRSPLFAACLFFPILQKPYGTWAYFKSLQQKIDELLYAQIRDRRQVKADAAPGTDILSLLIAARDENGDAMTDGELRDELMTLLLAGNETTANTAAWAMYGIYSNPEVHKRLRAELLELGETPDPAVIAQLPYLNAVCNESLRLYPVAVLTTPRMVKAPVVIQDYAFEPGAILYGSIYLTHRRPDLYPDPLAFKPERFLERSYTPFEFLPFGGGERRCIGEALALFELKLIVAGLVVNSALQLADQRPEIPRRSGVIVTPGRGVPMVLQHD